MKERKSDGVTVWPIVTRKASDYAGGTFLPRRSFAFLLFRFLVALLLPLTPSLVASAQPRSEGIGPGGRYYPVHSFQDDFQVFDEATRAYVPYIPELHADQTALSTYIDLESNRHYKLLLMTRRDGYLFINAALRRNIRAGQWQVLDIDSLFRVYRRPEVFLTLYGAPGIDDKQLYIGYPRSATQKTIVLRDDNLSVRPRPMSVYGNMLSLCLLILLGYYAFLFSFHHRAFGRFFSLRDLLSLRAQEESFLISRPLSSVNLLFTLGLSLVVAYLIVFAQSRGLYVFSSRLLVPESIRFNALMGEFSLLTGLVFVAMVSKYLLIEVISGLYKLHEISNVHYFKIMQASLLFFTLLALLLSVIAYNVTGLTWTANALVVPLMGFYAVRLALLYTVIRAAEPIKNLYLFSYLCIVELIPLLIGLRFVL